MSFREVARQWFLYAKAVGSLDLEYESCPTVCGNDEADAPGDFCESCPVKEAADNFRDYSIAALENNPQTKDSWRNYGFDSLKGMVEEISDLEDLPISERSVKTHRLIQAFQSTRRRQERIDRDNERESKPE